MTPFMKNQNEYLQRMRRSVARQEEIAHQYASGKYVNLAQATAQRDKQLEDRNATLMMKNDAKVTNIIQTENYRRQMQYEQLQ